MPNPNPTGTSMWLEESNQSGQTPTNWVSHPSGIGYRRGSPGITTSSGGGGSGSSSTGPPIAGNAPTMDSGTSDGGAGQELGRLGNFTAGGNENSTATQPGPTSRAGQVAIAISPSGGAAAVSFRNDASGDVIGDVMNDRSLPGPGRPTVTRCTTRLADGLAAARRRWPPRTGHGNENAAWPDAAPKATAQATRGSPGRMDW